MDEATGILMVTIHHDGLDLSIPADPEDWLIQATLAFEDGKILNAIRALSPRGSSTRSWPRSTGTRTSASSDERLAKAGGFDTSGN